MNKDYTVINMIEDIIKTLFIWTYKILEFVIKKSIVLLFFIADLVYKHLICKADNIEYKPELEYAEFIEWDDRLLNPFSIVLGIDEENNIFKVDHKCTNNAHFLIAGTTGSGKSCEIRLIAYQMIAQETELYLIDFNNGVELIDFVDYSVNNEVITTKEKTLELLQNLVKEFERRLDLLTESRTKNIIQYNKKNPDKKVKQITIIIDELAELTDLDGLSKEEKKLTEQVISLLATLARGARKTFYNLIIGTQYPTMDILKAQIKRNMGVRICGMVDDETMEKVILGSVSTATEIKRAGQAVVSLLGKERYKIQTFYMDDEKMIELLNKKLKKEV